MCAGGYHFAGTERLFDHLAGLFELFLHPRDGEDQFLAALGGLDGHRVERVHLLGQLGAGGIEVFKPHFQGLVGLRNIGSGCAGGIAHLGGLAWDRFTHHFRLLADVGRQCLERLALIVQAFGQLLGIVGCDVGDAFKALSFIGNFRGHRLHR